MANVTFTIEYLASTHEMLKDFVTPECNQNFSQKAATLTINDFIPRKIKEFEEVYRKCIVDKTLKEQLEATDQSFKTEYGEQYCLANLKSEKRALLETHFRKHFETVVDLRLKKLREGKPYFEIDAIKKDCPNFKLRAEDFVGGKMLSAPPKKLREKIERQKEIKDNFLSDVEKKQSKTALQVASERAKLLENSEFQRLLLKWYLHLSKELKKPLDEIKEEDLKADVKYFEGLIADLAQQEEAKAKKIGDALLREEESALRQTKKSTWKKTGSKSSKKETKTSKSSSTGESQRQKAKEESINFEQNPLLALVLRLNSKSFKLVYSLHTRISRWTLAAEKARQFTNFDPISQTYVYTYANHTDEELRKEKRYHNLSGVEWLLACKEIVDGFCFPYTYKDKKTKDSKTGLGMFATCHFGSHSETGILYMGIGKNEEIYHALFVPFSERQFLPAQIAHAFDPVEDKPEGSEAWELTAHCSFSLVDESVIQMEIGKNAKERVTYRFYPLQ